MTKTASPVILNAVKELEKEQILRYTQNDKTSNPVILNAVKDLKNNKKYL